MYIDDYLIIGVIVLYALIVAGTTAYVARGKGRSAALWFVFGLVFGFLGLLIAAVMPSEKR